jgi:hypothetical protein
MENNKKYQECVNPFIIFRSELDLSTGEIQQSSFEKRCGVRRKDLCEPCSEVWRDDAYFALINGAKKHQGAITFLTLTAPGTKHFGKFHTAQFSGKASERCACRNFHKPADPIVGIPIVKQHSTDVDVFKKVVEFNHYAPRLTAVTLQKIWRLMAADLGKDIQDVRLPYVRVMEWQERGLIHTHIIFLGQIPTYIISKAINGFPPTNRSRRVLPASHKNMRWGEQFKVVHINSSDISQSKKLSGYVTKVVSYALKDIRSEDKLKKNIKDNYFSKLRYETNKVISCEKTFSECCLTSRKLNYKMNTNKRQNFCIRHRRGHHQIGFTGNVLSINRKWGFYLKDSRNMRKEYVRQNLMQDAGKASCLDKEKKSVTHLVMRKNYFINLNLLAKNLNAETVIVGANAPLITKEKVNVNSS